MTGKQMVKLYKKNGWRVLRITGGHYIMEKSGHIEPIPHHTKELRRGLEKHLLKVKREVT